jgi:hypothetical protein
MKLFTAMVALVVLGGALPAFASDATADRGLARNRSADVSVLSPDEHAVRTNPCACDCGAMSGRVAAPRADRGMR